MGADTMHAWYSSLKQKLWFVAKLAILSPQLEKSSYQLWLKL